MSMVDNTPTAHIAAKKGEIAETILLPGDPLRAQYIAENFLENPKQFNATRNMFGYTGTYKGRPVSVMGTGMGAPSIGIYSYGCKNLIRIGTAGALQTSLKVRDLVFAMGACMEGGYVRLMNLPGDYAPICSYELLEKAVSFAKEKGYSYHVGNVLSSDLMAPKGLDWADMGVLAAEMEAAALYTNAAAAGVNALAILTISNSIVTGEETTAEERQTSFTQMMEVALSLA